MGGYSYDQADRLTRWQSGSTTAQYGYGGDGMRQSKTVGSTTTNQLWDVAEGMPLLVQDGSTRYITGPGGLPIEQVDGSSSVLYYYQDQLGSTRGLLDGSGNTQATYTFDDYGNVTSKTGSATTPFGYAGQYTDPESGLQYLRARYYDPATAQFLTVDPIVGATGQPYNYTAGGPLNATDPFGLGCGWNPVCYAGEAKDWTVGHAPGIGRQIAISGLNGAVSFMGDVGRNATSGNPLRMGLAFLEVYGTIGVPGLLRRGAAIVFSRAAAWSLARDTGEACELFTTPAGRVFTDHYLTETRANASKCHGGLGGDSRRPSRPSTVCL